MKTAPSEVKPLLKFALLVIWLYIKFKATLNDARDLL